MALFKKKWFKYLIIDLLIGLALFGFLKLYSPNWQHEQDYYYITGVILFAFGWMFFVINEGIFDVIVYGIVQFGRSLFGKRMEKTFIEYRQSRDITEKTVYIMLWISALIFIIAGLMVNFVF